MFIIHEDTQESQVVMLLINVNSKRRDEPPNECCVEPSVTTYHAR